MRKRDAPPGQMRTGVRSQLSQASYRQRHVAPGGEIGPRPQPHVQTSAERDEGP